LDDEHTSRWLLHDGLRSTTAAPDRTAVVTAGRAHSYGELAKASQRLAAALQRGGARRGERIAIYMENGWPSVVSIYATLLAGGVLVLINPQTKAQKLQFILRDSGARVLLTDRQLADGLDARVPELKRVIYAGVVSPGHAADTFEAIVAVSAEPPVPVPVIPLDLAALIYTSGSTGDPKGVMQTHQSMVFAVESLTGYLRLSQEDRILCILPLSFDYGLYQLLMAVTLGATLVLERTFAIPSPIFECMRELRVTVFPAVPTAFAILLSIHRRSPLVFPSVTRVTSTAAAIPEEFLTGLREIFPNALIFKMYGLTECKRVSYLEPELVDAKPGSVGKAIPGTEVYLLSADGSPTPPGEIGILHVRGPHVMLGYWNRPDLTDEMLKPGKLPGERVLCTQDLFRLDADGFLYFVSRSDEIIKTRGEKVSPVEVESALYRIPGVREAAVIGVPDAVLGEAIVACVVAEPDSNLTELEVRAGAARYLENFMVPQQVVFCAHLPKTTSGKINRKRLLQPERELT
jgi:long-chain acyl-CoA synthetase